MKAVTASGEVDEKDRTDTKAKKSPEDPLRLNLLTKEADTILQKYI